MLHHCVCASACASVGSPSTLFSSGVMVAHLIPTLYFAMASAHSTVTVPAQGGGEGRGRGGEGRGGEGEGIDLNCSAHRGAPPAVLTSVVRLVAILYT